MACKTKGKCASPKKGNSKPKKKLTSTEFTISAPQAEKVYLAGDFNDWNPSEFSMRKFKNGQCKKKVKLKPGRYEYQFVVDGNWEADPQNPERTPTPFGSENSVIHISEEVYVFQ